MMPPLHDVSMALPTQTLAASSAQTDRASFTMTGTAVSPAAQGEVAAITPPPGTLDDVSQTMVKRLPTAGQNEAGQADGQGLAALERSLARINDVMRQRGIEFDINEATSTVVTRVIDQDSGELIRQIPSEEVLRIAERLEESSGTLIDIKA